MSSAIRVWDVQRTAMPPSGPRKRSGSRPLPPGSTSVNGPGQNARASARADSLNASPWASAISRLATSSRNGLSRARPLSAARARTSVSTGRDPKPYTVSVGYASSPPPRRCSPHAGRRRARVRFRGERERAHPSSRASASASRQSSSVVTLRLQAEPATTSTGNPACSHRFGIVGGRRRVGRPASVSRDQHRSRKALRGLRPPQPAARHGARHPPVVVHVLDRIADRDGGHGPDTAARPLDDRVDRRRLHEGPGAVVDQDHRGRITQRVETGPHRIRPGRAPGDDSHPLAHVITQPCGRLLRHVARHGRPPRAARRCGRGTAATRAAASARRRSSGIASAPPGPARTPDPAATITTPTSGGESTCELTDVLDRHDVHPAGHAGAGREKHAAEALPLRLGQPALETGYGPHFPAQAHFAQEQRVGRSGTVVHAGHQRRQRPRGRSMARAGGRRP